ncbi:MAG: hypothetical protein VX641_05890 [Planctomycetota bacterium]|nr:hypothetical protein [Planctomycetota bacterium]
MPGIIELFLFLLPFHGFTAQVDMQIPAAPPPPDEIIINLAIIDVSHIADREQTIELDFGTRVRWLQPELADPDAPAIRTLPLSEVDDPGLIVFNGRDLEQKLADQVRVTPEGEVIHRQRYQGTISAPMELHDFPFDEQTFSIQLLPLNQNGRRLEFVGFKNYTLKGNTLPGWTFSRPTLSQPTITSLDGQRNFTILELTYTGTRVQTFFFWKLFLPLTLIVFMAYAVFWLDPTVLASQIAVATSSVFTLIAYNFALSHMLPRTSYLSRADYFVIGCTILVFSALYVTVLTGILARSERHVRLARRIDFVSRGIYPMGFLTVCFLSFAG